MITIKRRTRLNRKNNSINKRNGSTMETKMSIGSSKLHLNGRETPSSILYGGIHPGISKECTQNISQTLEKNFKT